MVEGGCVSTASSKGHMYVTQLHSLHACMSLVALLSLMFTTVFWPACLGGAMYSSRAVQMRASCHNFTRLASSPFKHSDLLQT
jgi:hypothetical protein